MKSSSAKNKGNRFENHLLQVFKETLDSNTRRISGSGAGLDKNDLIIPNFNLEVEAKNQKVIHLLKDWEQLQNQLFNGGNKGVLAIRNPKEAEFKEILIVLSLEDWIELVKGQGGKIEVENNYNSDLRWKLESLKTACSKVIKELK